MNGVELRDAGVARVMENAEAWADDVECGWAYWLDRVAPPVFTIEQFRAWVTPFVGEPHHPNAWGGFALKVKKHIEPVGFVTSERPTSHARAIKTYRRRGNA